MTINFWLDQAVNETAADVTYLPYGSRSIRVRVQTKSKLPPLRIRPVSFLSVDTDNGIYRGYEDGVTSPSEADFELSWGGGHEEGPCSKTFDFLGAFEKCAEMEAGDTQVIIFTLRHCTTALPETAEITLVAYHDDEVQAQVKIPLKKPAALPDNLQRFIQMEKGHWSVMSGQYLPSYMSRWWPDEDIQYEQIDSVPPIRLELHKASKEMVLY